MCDIHYAFCSLSCAHQGCFRLHPQSREPKLSPECIVGKAKDWGVDHERKRKRGFRNNKEKEIDRTETIKHRPPRATTPHVGDVILLLIPESLPEIVDCHGLLKFQRV